MKHIMVDLETLGTKPGCAILSLGAVVFSAHGLGEQFYRVIRTKSCYRAGLNSDDDTLSWWVSQSLEAKQVLTEALSDTTSEPLIDVLKSFNDLLEKYGGTEGVLVWGNGANFDAPILRAAYEALGLTPNWHFMHEACYRTLKTMYLNGPKAPQLPAKKLISHHALFDALHQAECAASIFLQLGLYQGENHDSYL